MRAGYWMASLLAAAITGLSLVVTVPAAAAPAGGTTAGRAAPGQAAPGGSTLWSATYHGPLAGQSKAAAEALSPDGSKLFVTGLQGYALQTGSRSWATVAYSTATGTKLWLRAYPGSSNSGGAATTIAASQDGSMVFVSGYVDSANVRHAVTVAYNAATGATVWVQKFRDDQAPTAVVLSPDGSTLFVETGDYRTLAYDTGTGQQRWVSSVADLGTLSTANAIAVSPDGSRLYVTGQGMHHNDLAYQTAAYDAATGTTLWIVHPPSLAPNGASGESLAVSPDGSTVYMAGVVPVTPGGAVIAFRSTTGATLWRNNDLSGSLWRLAMSPDGATLAVFGDASGANPTDGYDTRALNAATGSVLWAHTHGFTPATDPIGVAMSPDGATVYITGMVAVTHGYAFDTLAYTTATGAQLWEARFLPPAKTFGEARPSGMVVSPDGSMVFVTGDAPNAGDVLSFQTVAYHT